MGIRRLTGAVAATLVATAGLGAALVTGATAVPAVAQTPTAVCASQTFTYTGSAQSCTAPPGARAMQVVAVGAGGGAGGGTGGDGGEGGSVSATIPVDAGTQLQITVGGAGVSGQVKGDAGFNGGGEGGTGHTDHQGGGGGGASDIRISPYDLDQRLVVAGGGGGGGNGIDGGLGGDGGDGGQQGTAGGDANPYGCGGGGPGGDAGGSGDNSGACTFIPPLSQVTFDPGGSGVQGTGGEGGVGSAIQQNGLGGGGGGGGDFGGGGGAGAACKFECDLQEGGGGAGGGSSAVDPSATDVSYATGGNAGNGSVQITFVIGPVADAYGTPSGEPLNVAAPGVIANDGLAGTSYSIVDDVSPGDATFQADGGFTYQPPAGFVGTATGSYCFSVQFANGVCTSTTAPITIYVQAVVTQSYGSGTNTFTVPAGVSALSVRATGGQGGVGGGSGGPGGGGAEVQAVVPVSGGEVLKIVVGGAGLTSGNGGANGGGSGGNAHDDHSGGGGGGASTVADSSGLLLVAGGGGGGGNGVGGVTGGLGGNGGASGVTGGIGSSGTTCPADAGGGGATPAAVGGGGVLCGGNFCCNGSSGSGSNGGTGGGSNLDHGFAGGGGGGGVFGGGGGGGGFQLTSGAGAGGGGGSSAVFAAGATQQSITAGAGTGAGSVDLAYTFDAVDDSYSVAADTTLSVDAPGVLANDATSGSYTVTGAITPGTGTFQSDGSFTYVPPAGFVGTATGTYCLTASFNTGACVSDLATITVDVNINAVNDTYTMAGDTTLTVPAPGIVANDTIPDGFGAMIVDPVSPGTAVFQSDGGFTYTPPGAFSGTATGTYCLTADSLGGACASKPATISITVDPLVPPPLSYATTIGQTLTVPAPGILTGVPNGLSYTAGPIEAAAGTITYQPDGGFTYAPNASFTGTDQIVYCYSTVFQDDEACTAGVTGAITFTVTNPSRITADNDSYTMLNGTTLTVPAPGILANDSVPSGYSYTITTPFGGDTTSTFQADGSFSFAPPANVNGQFEANYCISPTFQGTCDPNSTTGTILVTVDNPLAVFGPTGSTQTYTVPGGISTLQIVAQGGQGGAGATGGAGGLGASATTTFPVTPGDVITMTVGAAGGAGQASGITGTGGAGGTGGGGTGGGADAGPGVGNADGGGGGGGGATTVQTPAGTIVVGGGGGGAGGGPGATAAQIAGGAGGQTGENAPDVNQGGASGGNGGAGGGFSGPVGAPGSAGQGGVGAEGEADAAAGGGGGGGGVVGGGGGAGSEFGFTGGGGGGGSSSGPAGTTFITGGGPGDGVVAITLPENLSPRPDAQIRVGTSGPFVGVGVFPPAQQRVSATATPGGSQTYQVRLQNDGTEPDRFTLADSGVVSGLGNTAKQMLVDGVDVTPQVDAGTYQTPELDPGADLLVTVRLQAPERPGVQTALTMRATSTTNLSRYDEVSAVIASARVAPGMLAFTGSDPVRPVAIGLVLFLLGAALVAGARLRRRPSFATVTTYDAVADLRAALRR